MFRINSIELIVNAEISTWYMRSVRKIIIGIIAVMIPVCMVIDHSVILKIKGLFCLSFSVYFVCFVVKVSHCISHVPITCP